jgi:N utilization substance protein B
LAENQKINIKSNRRLARELALRLLFQQETSDLIPEQNVFLFEQNFNPKNDEEYALDMAVDSFDDAWPLAKELFFGVEKNKDQLDGDIKKAAINWSLGRMASVDRSLIRLAYYEMLYRDDIPPKVSLNEALEIAKSFGDEDSKAFINGVLDRLLNKMKGIDNE